MANDEDEFLEQNIKSNKAESPSSTYLAVAFLLSALPVFLFYTVYKLDDIGVVYLVVTAISTVLLSTAYQKVTYREKTRLMRFRKENSTMHRKYNMTSSEFDSEVEQITGDEALYFSLFRNNLTYVIFFLFFAFYAFRDINREFCYAVSVGAASVLVWKFSDWF
eukprot:CAMPEP_0184489110 /NCGR_PEP_ID=MMETSP0113_2-20130426/14434_1 /TAXON_ID=91329 /ORGANISM="Norrisiella sphaerica, Strain BC52" /LENGTH=163 /DNA_ID=CAMNT_0026872345 /DNA_START=24 /DNA_END=515 /DNA_ORIENTATION=+